VYLSAHASLRRRNADGTWRRATGWGHGQRISDAESGATYFTVSLAHDAEQPLQLTTCEPAFAKADASTCFIGADFDQDGSADGFARWGWSNGPLAPGTGVAWPVYAGTNRCDVDQGKRIGSLSVSYRLDGNAQVVFDRVGDFVLDEEHLHVGNEPLPRGSDGRFSVAPDRYPIGRDLDDATHTEHRVGGLRGDVHVAYHVVACRNQRSSRLTAR
jgi:hypothetical protein